MNKDVTLKELLTVAASIQHDNYSGDRKLTGKLIHGALRNLASIPTDLWDIDMFTEPPVVPRGDLMNCIDSLIYALSLLSIQNADLDELCNLIDDRQRVVYMLHNTHAELVKLRSSACEIAIVDMDGVLFPYPQLLDQFCSREDLSGLTYEAKKDLYRRSGIKGSADAIPFAKEVMDALKSSGLTVLILSSRPVSLYPEVYMQSLDFLKRNDICPHILSFKDSKHHARELEGLWDKCVIFIDDDERQISAVRSSHPHVHCVRALNDGTPNHMGDVLEAVKDFLNERAHNIKDRNSGQT